MRVLPSIKHDMSLSFLHDNKVLKSRNCLYEALIRSRLVTNETAVTSTLTTKRHPSYNTESFCLIKRESQVIILP